MESIVIVFGGVLGALLIFLCVMWVLFPIIVWVYLARMSDNLERLVNSRNPPERKAPEENKTSDWEALTYGGVSEKWEQAIIWSIIGIIAVGFIGFALFEASL